MQPEDEDIAQFMAAQKRARSKGGVKLLRVLGAGIVAAAACLVMLYYLGVFYESSGSYIDEYGNEWRPSQRSEMRRGMGSVVLVIGGTFAVGSVTFLLAFRLLGGKVDKDTWHTVLSMVGLRR